MANRTICNPATGEPVGELEVTPHRRIDDTLAAAHAVQRVWAGTPRHARYAVMLGFADLVEANSTSIARLLTAESGKPFEQTAGEVALCARLFRGRVGPLPVGAGRVRRLQVQWRRQRGPGHEPA